MCGGKILIDDPEMGYSYQTVICNICGAIIIDGEVVVDKRYYHDTCLTQAIALYMTMRHQDVIYISSKVII